VLPKGHIEEGETPEMTAHREVLEETGVDAEVTDAIGDEAFAVDGKQIRVRYFLMRVRGSNPGSESREHRWCSAQEAERLLAFDISKAILRRAAAHSA
jgi:8-oxo-dGTP pyrophosphatase MutT (NUDIX family)